MIVDEKFARSFGQLFRFTSPLSTLVTEMPTQSMGNTSRWEHYLECCIDFEPYPPSPMRNHCPNPYYDDDLADVKWLTFAIATSMVLLYLSYTFARRRTPEPTQVYNDLNKLIKEDRFSQTEGISEHLRAYLLSIENSPHRVKNLNQEQLEALEEGHDSLICSISGRLKDMPVLIYDEPYDFSSVLALEADEQGRRIHPKTRESFLMIEVQAHRPCREAIKNLLDPQPVKEATKFPAFFSKNHVKADRICWSKVVAIVENNNPDKAIPALKQLAEYAKEHGRVNIQEKATQLAQKILRPSA